jgi:hypothetical protein
VHEEEQSGNGTPMTNCMHVQMTQKKGLEKILNIIDGELMYLRHSAQMCVLQVYAVLIAKRMAGE